MRCRLKDLIKDTLQEWECDVSNDTIAQITDHLVENGVIVLPIPYGTELHFLWSREHADNPKPPRIHSTKDWIFEVRDDGKTWLSSNDIPVGYYGEYLHQLGKSVFLTQEQAKKALERSENGT